MQTYIWTKKASVYGVIGLLIHICFPYSFCKEVFKLIIQNFNPWIPGANLLQTVTHEIGHSLGLEHSNDRDAVMYPFIKPYDPGFKLGLDDIQGIHELYGGWIMFFFTI